MVNTSNKTATELLTHRVKLIKTGKYTEVEFPFKALTNITKALYPGTVTLLCGAPGSCKSLFILQCLAYWHTEGVPACLYALEDDLEHHMMRTLAQRSGETGITEIGWIRQNSEKTEEILTACEDFTNEFAEHISLPNPDNFTFDSTTAWILERAKEGRRVICIDPVTLIPTSTSQSWEEEKNFIKHSESIAVEYGCSIVLVTHPKNNASKKPTMEALSGSAAYSRFSHTILWLEAHGCTTHSVMLPIGASEMPHNRTMHCLKARNGDGLGVQDAFNFSSVGLTMTECGPICERSD